MISERDRTFPDFDSSVANSLLHIDVRDLAESGQELHCFVSELYPICRSITGNGIRETLSLIQRRIPLQVFEVPSGTAVFDWTVPKESDVRDAYIKEAPGNRVLHFRVYAARA